jgi:hypothetical protein
LFALDPKTANSRTSSSVEELTFERRVFLSATLSAFAAYFSGCGGRTSPPAKPLPPKPRVPLAIASLDVLVPLPGLRWLVLARPREIAEISWLQPAITLLLDKERLDRSAEVMGFDLRTVPEAIWAGYRAEEGEDDVSLQLIRHASDPLSIERLFRDRLSTDISRSIDDSQVVRVSGRIGKTVHALATLGSDVLCLQQDGSLDRGPCRISALLAQGKLKRTQPVFHDESMRILAQRFESAPLRLFAPGPFEGETARGVRGLLAAATAIGAAFRPTNKQGISLEIAVTGDFSTSGAEASRKLASSWDDLASRPLGHLLGLDAPQVPSFPNYGSDTVGLVVELDPRKLAKGLADATSNQIREIMQ